MIYFIFGDQPLMVEKSIKKLTQQLLGSDINDFNYRVFDARETLFDDIVDECELIPFGAQKKVVLLDYAYFLAKDSSEKVKIDKKQDTKRLEKYLKNPLDETDLIIVTRSAKINESNKIAKVLFEKAKVTALQSVTAADWPVYVQKYFSSVLKKTISREAVDELGERINYDLTAFVNEADKLTSYTDHVTLDDIKKLTPKPLENDVFLMINSLMGGNKKTAMRIFFDIRDSGIDNEPVRLLNLISGQIRILSQVLYLKSQAMNEAGIASKLGLNQYRVKKLLENARFALLEKVYKALDELYELDNQIKNRLIDGFYGLELYLLKVSFK